MRIPVIVGLAVLAALAGPARAEIEKTGEPCETGICLHWWPKLAPPKGWHQDRGSSLKYESNALAPDGSSFSDAEAVIYARALSKPGTPKTLSVAMLIEEDKSEVHSQDPDMAIKPVEAIVTADGRKLPAFTFVSAVQDTWEQVAYGEEGEYYLIFTLSARNEAAYQRALPAYLKLVRSYREKPPGRGRG